MPADGGSPPPPRRDTGGIRLDSGLPDSGPPDLGAPDLGGADSGFEDLGVPDLGEDLGTDLVLDAGPTDLGPEDLGPADLGPMDQGPLDQGAPDLGVPDQGPSDLGAPDQGPPDLGQDAGMFDGGADAGSPPSSALVITEFRSLGTGPDWIELHNAGAQTIEGTALSLTLQSFGAATLRSATDPSGTGVLAPLLPGAYALLYPNPSAAAQIPTDADLLIGAPGALGDDALNDAGDRISVANAQMVLDVVDFSNQATDPAQPVAAGAFPVVPQISTQLSPQQLDAVSNDQGDAWCARIFRGATPGAANGSCRGFVISEVLYNYDAPAGGADTGQEFLEIAGPAGGSLSDVQIATVEGSGASAGTVDRLTPLTGARMPLLGLYVVADDDGSGGTFVANSNEIADLSFENGDDAIQLLYAPAGATPVLLDAFGHGAIVAGLTDLSNNLAALEGTPVANWSTGIVSANWARSDDELDTQDNLADFRHDPSPSPGARNGASDFAVTSITPNNALLADAQDLQLTGADFTDDMSVTLAGAPLTCTASVRDALVCTAAAGVGAPRIEDITVAQRPEAGGSVTLVGALTRSGANNESDTAPECDFCNLQFPTTAMTTTGVATAVIYGRIFEAGLTDTSAGQAPGVIAELGYGPSGVDPTTSNAWQWQTASFNVEVGNDDEYQGTLTVPAAGTYSYTFRFSLDGGLTWSFADTDGVGSNGGLDFSATNLGVLTVN